MPAGHGKTLVGGLIGEFNRINNGWRVVYTCATRQLAAQTNKLLQSYGINSVLLIGKSSEFSQIDLRKYQRSEAICVTTYGHIFNTNPKFDDANLIIFDDAHATEYAINDLWSVKINRQEDKEIFNSLISTLGDSIPPNIKDKLIYGTYDPLHDGIDIVSFPQWFKKRDDIRSLLDSKVSDTKHYHSWSMIRTHLHSCQIFVSYSDIVIKPIIPPNKKLPAFINANERIYMSATLGDAGELERMFGVQDIHYIRKFPRTSNKVSGRRLILFPEDHFEDDELTTVIKETIENQSRSLILTPSNNELEKVKKKLSELLPHFTILDNKDIEDDLSNFTSQDKTILALAGRYEGIDLKDEDCRLQIMHELPVAINYDEKFLQDRLNATELLKSKLTTRIIQGLGRCTRGETDYAVVLFIGKYVGHYLFKDEFRKRLPAEIDAEINFGLSQIDHIKNKEIWHKSLSDFLNQTEEWKRVETYLERQTNKLSKEKEQYTQTEATTKLYNSAKYEIDYIYYLWEEDFENAHKSADKILSEFSRVEELKGYRAWWNYLIATVATLQNDEEKVKKYLAKSLSASSNKVWLDKRAIDLNKSDTEVIYSDEIEIQVERITNFLKSFGDRDNRFNKDWKNLIEGLKSKEAHLFESSLKSLGTCLGFYSEKPEGQGDPDGVWNLTNTWLSFEAKTNVEDSNGYIPLNDIRQTFVHKRWVINKFNLPEDSDITVIMISPKNKIESSSQYAADGIYLVHPRTILEIANSLELILREGLQKLKYGDASSIRSFIAEKLIENNLTIDKIKERFTKVTLRDLVE
jgi:Helicase C-terminal domain